MKGGEAFYLPVVDSDLKDVNKGEVLTTLNRLLRKPVKYIGHNIKYDYVLLRRCGIKIETVHFDTLLAANECFGDWPFWNLGYLSQKLLKAKSNSYKEVVGRRNSLMEIPFKTMVSYACQDADITFRLYSVLRKELADRGVLEQYMNDTMSRMIMLGDLEHEGLRINATKLDEIRKTIIERINLAERNVWEKIGKEIDLESGSEIISELKELPVLRNLIANKSYSFSLLERLAIRHERPRLIVVYKRIRKQLDKIDEISKRIRDNTIRPLFNQTKSKYGQLTSIHPDLFDIDENIEFRRCLPEKYRGLFRDSKKSLTRLGRLAVDPRLSADLTTNEQENYFRSRYIFMKELSCNEVLLSIVTGLSNARLSRRFLIDELSAATVRQDLERRYPKLFDWLAEFRGETLSNGSASDGNRKRYFEGLASSNLEKKEKALINSVRWLIQY